VVLERLQASLSAPLTALTAIDDRALECWERQWQSAKAPGLEWSDWDWRAVTSVWWKHIDRFEVAIWSDDHLCGLGIGKPSQRRNNLSVYMLEGSPIVDHPLKGHILLTVLETAQAYGTALECKELRLVKPLQGMIGRYEKLGFQLETPYKATAYCRRNI
jgi:hypothetical protein